VAWVVVCLFVARLRAKGDDAQAAADAIRTHRENTFSFGEDFLLFLLLLVGVGLVTILLHMQSAKPVRLGYLKSTRKSLDATVRHHWYQSQVDQVNRLGVGKDTVEANQSRAIATYRRLLIEASSDPQMAAAVQEHANKLGKASAGMRATTPRDSTQQ
jgi:hypothetical protein